MKTKEINFLGIGAQKAGTTWLYQHLRKHPGIWIPPRKELHYFNRSPKYASASRLASNHLFRCLFGRGNADRIARKGLLGALRAKDWRAVRWTLRYHLGTCCDEWYLSLFEDGGEKIKGEITPCYSILDVKDVMRIRDLFPNLKIILLLRNPIDRAWSQIRFAYGRGIFTWIDDTEKIRDFIAHPRLSLRGDYVRTIHIWRTFFPEEQMFIGWFDDIVRDPRKLLSDVFEFLGVDPAALSACATVNKKFNVSPERDMPMEIRRYLAAKYHPELKNLSDLVGGYSLVWLNDADSILKNADRGCH